jgi:hypothetical protein
MSDYKPNEQKAKAVTGIENILTDAKRIVGGAVMTASHTFWATVAGASKTFGFKLSPWTQSRVDDQAREDEEKKK